MPTIVTEVVVIDKSTSPPYEKRFQFEDENEAWLCYELAKKHGFEAKAEKIKKEEKS